MNEQTSAAPERSPQQTISDGYGPEFHRIYSVRLASSEATARQAMADLQTDLNRFSPATLARFEKTRGTASILKRGDEFQIHISGPWDGPVRVTHVDSVEFRLATLDGHLEAGEIAFRLLKKTDSEQVFEIESFARSSDAAVDFVYDKLPIAKLAQTAMWVSFCKSFADHVAKLAGIESDENGEVETETERRDEETGQWQRQ